MKVRTTNKRRALARRRTSRGPVACTLRLYPYQVAVLKALRRAQPARVQVLYAPCRAGMATVFATYGQPRTFSGARVALQNMPK